MQIKLLVPLCGPTGGGSEGDVIEWPDDDAYNIVSAGYAEFVPATLDDAAPVADEAEAKPAKRTRKTK